MSRLTEVQKQYQGYVAAREAVKKTDPGTVEVVYKSGGRTEDGVFIYDPRENKITVRPKRYMYENYINIDVTDVPALIKALREFFE
jgi:hypothetical protein